ncbi:death-associated inhibitor of apoptosis 2-like [Lycorma delicatula]|uniref:death-associated inhibitor of apoptosis 2-like n=1 Tax=Lycorma delicatula TaxID=130591 RepID=UPI003F51A810
MNFESSRLRTFRNWPANAVVDARRIAKAGFYYMGQGLEVQCFSCGGRISEWNYGDKVMTRHRWLDPRCPFVVNPANSGNVPIEGMGSSSSSLSALLPVSDRTDSLVSSPTSPGLQYSSPPSIIRRDISVQITRSLRTMYQENELARLQSFESWPKPYIVTPESLARAGFYYTRESDTVKCAFCNVMVGHWEEGDDPIAEHRRHFPDCTFLLAIQTIPPQTENQEFVDFPPDGITIRTPSENGDSVSLRDLGVQSHKRAKHPKYSMHEARLQTFVNWPGDVLQTPDDLASAGFYYAGCGDQVKCFHCDGGLRMWDPHDDPWVEHARWYPECGYIILVKGQSFVENVLKDYPPLDAEELAHLEGVKQNEREGSFVHPPRPLVPITEAELQELLSSPEAVAALQVGLEVSRVKVALRQRAETGGLPFHSTEALINAALDVQLEEVPEPEISEAWGTPPSSPVTLWPRCNEQTQSETASEDNATEPEDAVDYTSATFDDQFPTPIEPPSDDEIENGVIDDEVRQEVDEAPTVIGAGDRASPPISNFTPEDTTQKVSLEEENRRLKEARLCKICMDREIEIVFLPCGHLVTCVQCAHSLSDCPLCRKEILGTLYNWVCLMESPGSLLGIASENEMNVLLRVKNTMPDWDSNPRPPNETPRCYYSHHRGRLFNGTCCNFSYISKVMIEIIDYTSCFG